MSRSSSFKTRAIHLSKSRLRRLIPLLSHNQLILLVLLFLFFVAIFIPQVDAQALRPYKAAVHVHSNFSSGAHSIRELAQIAERNGLDILILTDHAQTSMDWGIEPYQNLLRFPLDEGRSVFKLGIKRYLSAIASGNRAHPRVLIIPGIEASANYYFTGNPLKKTLMVHNWRRHLHIIGLTSPESYLSLPLASGFSLKLLKQRGFAGFPTTVWSYFLPFVFFFISIFGIYLMQHQKFSRVVGLLVFLAAIPAMVNELPFLQPPFNPYGGNPGTKPYQRLIDAATARGGIVLWAHQRSRSQGQREDSVVFSTSSTPPLLTQSLRYTGFDAIHEDPSAASKPGGQWDQVLKQYLSGNRKTPVWAYGGADFHNTEEVRIGKRLSDIQTVFLLQNRTQREVLAALQEGRMYVVRGYRFNQLRLDLFEILARDRNLKAFSGETVQMEAPPEIHFSISTDNESTRELLVQLIRNGKIVKTFKGETPIDITYTDNTAPRKGHMYYRLDVRTPGKDNLLTNPIFVKRPRD